MKKILLVDDAKEIHQMVLQSVGGVAEVTWATSLDEAVDRLNGNKFELMILDIELPDGDGIEFCSRIKPHFPDVQVLFMTSHLALSEKELAFKVGGEGYITKPFSREALCERVKTLGKIQEFNDVLELYLVVHDKKRSTA